MVAARATRRYSPRQPYVPYAYFSVSQSHYAGQAPFNLPEHAGLWLRDATGRPLNGTPALGGEHDRWQTFSAGLCSVRLTDDGVVPGGPHMPAQGLGMESRLYDFSLNATRRFFLEKVMAPFVAAPECDVSCARLL